MGMDRRDWSGGGSLLHRAIHLARHLAGAAQGTEVCAYTLALVCQIDTQAGAEAHPEFADQGSNPAQREVDDQ